MHSPTLGSRRRACVAVLVAAATIAACSSDATTGSGGSVPATVALDSVALDTGSTEVDSSALSSQPVTTATAAETTTTTPPGDTSTTAAAPVVPVYPLTGVENPDPVVAARPALVVKIDNAPGARPQTGFNAADIVYEEIVNDNLTRFAMVFQSQNSNPVGPIRSGRLQDVDLFTAYNHPLFAWSGGNATVTNAINSSDLVNIGPSKAPELYFRSRGRSAPHNLYSNTDALWTRTPLYAPPAAQQFSYHALDAAPGGAPSQGVAIVLDSIDARWDWDADSGTYLRMMEGRPHTDGAGGQVSTNNVVVLAMDYLPGISHSPDAQTIGSNEVFVFTGGNYIHGTWSREDRSTPFTLTADDGSPILLQPGRTFIELPRLGSTLPLPAE